jgi:RNA methyltransferase, TrmH family
MPEVISSAANPLVKRVRLLADRRQRRREGAFVVRGIQPVWQAVEAGADVEVLIAAPGLLAGPAAAMVAEQEARGVRVARLSDELFGRIGDRDRATGLAAIVRGRLGGLDSLRLPPPPAGVYVALHQVANPGNLGTIIRTADAAGAAGVILVGSCTDPFDPVAVKASMGAIFGVPVVTAAAGAGEFLTWCRSNGVSVAVASGRAAPGSDQVHRWTVDAPPTASTGQRCSEPGGIETGAGTAVHDEFWDVQLPLPAAILLGTERVGLPDEVLAAGDVRLRIPMTGTAESLNLAVAAGILLFEAWHQRRP